MNWARDNAYIGRNGPDARKVFRYNPRPSTAIKLARSTRFRMQVWSLETHEQWERWLDQHCNDTDHGLILILARRSGESTPDSVHEYPMSVNDWIAHLDDNTNSKPEMRRADTFAILNEKSEANRSTSRTTGKRSSIRDLPFLQSTFENVCRKFQVHDSIIRAISRADVPNFSYERVNMLHPALVYNCRTPNSWESDMAMSATHYPASGLTYAVFYGCTIATEKFLLRKLQLVGREAAHPLLIPGLLAELELSRHTRLVEAKVTEVETKIFELNFQSERLSKFRPAEIEHRNKAKRTAWLDLTYLRNSIITWNSQLEKMKTHAKELTNEYSGSVLGNPQSPRCSETTAVEYPTISTWIKTVSLDKCNMESTANEVSPSFPRNAEMAEDFKLSISETEFSTERKNPSQSVPPLDCSELNSLREDPAVCLQRMMDVGRKIESRLCTIEDEYDEKIRDCTMRVDGMAMATQWSHGETAVEISLATRRDSKVMKSISLVTMIFLPGTFFATVFSMTFFDWFDSDGGTRVSSYLWIYIVVTVFFTAITIGLWYYFVIYRNSSTKPSDETEASKV